MIFLSKMIPALASLLLRGRRNERLGNVFSHFETVPPELLGLNIIASLSNRNRLIVVSFTERNGKIRIINARKTNK